MATTRAASMTPVLLRATQRTAAGRQSLASLHRQQPAVAMLVPLLRRAYAPEPSTQSGAHDGFPPPGYDPKKAKQPRQADKQDAQTSKSGTPAEATGSPSAADKDGATAHAKSNPDDERSLSQLAAEKTASDKKIEKKKEEDKKMTLWQKVKREVVHYWDGTKLLATEVRISSKLALKMAAGYELTRREHRQDLGRLVPFSVFVIVPFAELLLPIALRLFPNLLPSTYEGQKSKDAKAKNLRETRKEVSSFMRQTLRETGLPVSAANAQKEEFTEFFRKVRTTGQSPTAADVIKVCKIFKDDLTLDNLSRPQLVAICRYMSLNTFGTDAMLRYQVRHRMRQIKRDDKAISYEGVESLSVPELQMAAASRGLRTHGMSPGRLREDLQMWLDLRLKYGVPSTLLVLSNAFVYAQGKDTELSSQIDALQSVLASVPEELFHEIELEVHTAEGAATNKQRLEVLKEQQELIDEEGEQSKEETEQGREQPKDDEDIDEQEEAVRELQASAEARVSGKEGEAKDAAGVRAGQEHEAADAEADSKAEAGKPEAKEADAKSEADAAQRK